MASDKPWKPSGDGPNVETHSKEPLTVGGMRYALDLALQLGGLDRQCQSQRRMIAHLRDRLAKCEEHNRRLKQEAAKCQAEKDRICNYWPSWQQELARRQQAERQLAECQAELLKVQKERDGTIDTCIGVVGGHLCDKHLAHVKASWPGEFLAEQEEIGCPYCRMVQLAECQAQAAEWRAIESKAQELVQSRDEKLAELQALKSLICPVLMRPETLREMLGQIAAMRDALTQARVTIEALANTCQPLLAEGPGAQALRAIDAALAGDAGRAMVERLQQEDKEL